MTKTADLETSICALIDSPPFALLVVQQAFKELSSASAENASNPSSLLAEMCQE